ncbi:Asp-tRNA(Asn)/Glu-tRNA(Gln) amidotransferase subunit GatA [Rickettsiales bacterium LUAb2]
MKLIDYTVTELEDLLSKKQVTSVEITAQYLENISKHKDLNAYITVTENLALEAAKAADVRINNNQKLSKLDGIPLAIKDNFLTKGVKTTNASKFYSEFIPPFESTITQMLKDAGMVCLGKTNMDEFAMGSSNQTSYFGEVKNPWVGNDNAPKVPGGSSGGSAAAVAAKIAPLALGTDTGGSIRQPAAFCGIVGLKPTFGLCSRFGIFAFASSLDQAGPMSRNVLDNALLLNHMVGYDPKESTMLPFDKPDYVENISKGNIKKFKVGIIKEYEQYNIHPDIKAAYQNTIKLMEKEGIEVKELSFPRHNLVIPVYYIIAPVEASSNLARYDGIRYGNRVNGDNLLEIYQNSRTSGFGDEVKTRILTGTFNLLSDNFPTTINAAKIRSVITQDFANIFKEVDFILSPTAANTAFALDEKVDPMEMYYSDVFTGSVNLAGIPAISLPHSLATNGMPIGLQLIGNYYSEASIYQMSYWLEQQFNFNFVPSL